MRRRCLPGRGGRGHVWWVWGECGGDVGFFFLLLLLWCIFRDGGVGSGGRGGGGGEVDRKGDIELYVIIIFSCLGDLEGRLNG